MNKNKTRKFKKLNCSPKRELKYSCLNTKTLLKMRNIWNKNFEKKINTNNPKQIWIFFKRNLKDCYNEKCWIDTLFKNKNKTQKIKKSLFAPSSPISWKNNITEWLTSNDIINVMSQYEKKYPEFKFLGPSPIDFDVKKSFNQCVWNDLCKFSLKNYISKGFRKIGVIFNTDPHYKGGSHWVCLFIDIDLKYIYFFDSTGDKPQEEIKNLVKKIQKQAINLNVNLKYIVNSTEHQKGETECGIYVLVAIILLLKKKKQPKDFNIRIPDKKMIEVRNILFNVNN
tara:strand:+ start:3500 stop:4348 length:849 start_codon:yes stop_codon:yes gene_type:complete